MSAHGSHNRANPIASRLFPIVARHGLPVLTAFVLLIGLVVSGNAAPVEGNILRAPISPSPVRDDTLEDDVGDINEDGFVDVSDLGIVVAGFGRPPVNLPSADANGDGRVDILDLALVASNQGRRAPRLLQAMVIERAFPNLTFRRLTNLVQPDDGHNHIFVTEQPGHIRVFPNDQRVTRADTFLDISDRVNEGSNEEGLLGLAFDPDYKNNGFFYVYYSAADPRRSVVSRFSVTQHDPNLADRNSETVIMQVAQPFRNHNGGQLAFGPDGYLYVGLGDGGSGGDPRGNGQNTSTLLGSILRIDVSSVSDSQGYELPPDNPFVGVSDAQDEIWAYGLRNPWRFSFDERTGTLWVADVGQNRLEEVDVVEKGLNYGWNAMEGTSCFSPGSGCDKTGLELPIAEYSRSAGNCSVTGGYVYGGRGMPSLLGAYVYGDFCSGRIWGLRYDGGSVTEHLLLVNSSVSITSFGQDLDLNLYILSRDDGIYRLVP